MNISVCQSIHRVNPCTEVSVCHTRVMAGRPALPTDQRRTARLVVRATAAELDEIRRAAELSGLSVSTWLRDIVLRAAR